MYERFVYTLLWRPVSVIDVKLPVTTHYCLLVWGWVPFLTVSECGEMLNLSAQASLVQ